MQRKGILTIKSKNEVLYLPLDDILYIQADGNYCDIHLVDGGVINTLTRQRAEMSRMIAAQFPTEGGETLCTPWQVVSDKHPIRDAHPAQPPAAHVQCKQVWHLQESDHQGDGEGSRCTRQQDGGWEPDI